MQDFSQLSDQEIDQMLEQKLTATRIPKMDYSTLSDQELDDMVMQKFEEKRVQAEASDRPVQAFIENFGDTATLGYLPQIQAATAPLFDKANELFNGETDQKLREQGFNIQDKGDTFTERRDQNRSRIESLEQSNPMASMSGDVGGAVVTAIPAGSIGAPIKGANALQKVSTAAKIGGTYGALRNPGDQEGELDPLQVQERLKNTAQDALLGAVLQGGAESVGKIARAIKNSPANIKNFAEAKAFKSSGAMLKDFRKQFGNNKVGELGRTMIDKGIVNYGDDVADIAKKAEIARLDVGNSLDDIYRESEKALLAIDPSRLPLGKRRMLEKSVLDIGKFADQYKKNLARRLKGKAGSESVFNRVSKELDEIASNGVVDLDDFRKVRRSIDDQINFSKANNELAGVQQEFLNLRSKMQDLAKERVAVIDKITRANRLKDLNQANRDYSNLAEITKIANDRVARDQANAAFGLRERISGGAGAMIGSYVGGIPGAIAGGVLGSMSTKVARQYGTPMVARASDKVAKLLLRNDETLGKFAEPLIKAASIGPKEFVVAVESFMNDPEFKKINKRNSQPRYNQGLANEKR